MEGKKCFIKTTDEETAQQLIKLGFKLVEHTGSTYTFINDSHIQFDNSRKKCVYSDILTM